MKREISSCRICVQWCASIMLKGGRPCCVSCGAFYGLTRFTLRERKLYIRKLNRCLHSNRFIQLGLPVSRQSCRQNESSCFPQRVLVQVPENCAPFHRLPRDHGDAAEHLCG